MKDGKKAQSNKPEKTTRAKRKRNSPSPSVTRSQRVLRSKSPPQCGVCMEPVKQRGLLDSCSHVFCFSCIMKWCKRCSTCPHCKRDVSIIKKSDVTGKRLQSKHSIRKRVLRDTLDREEFQQRRRHIVAGEHNRSQRGFMPLSQVDSTHYLLSVHQSIRDNMINRFSSTLRGLQDNLLMLNSMQPQIQPFSFSICNIPIPQRPLWTADIGFPSNTEQTSLHVPHSTTTYFQNHVYSVPNVRPDPHISSSVLNLASGLPQYSSMITQQLASTLASLSYHEEGSMFSPQQPEQSSEEMDFRYYNH